MSDKLVCLTITLLFIIGAMVGGVIGLIIF